MAPTPQGYPGMPPMYGAAYTVVGGPPPKQGSGWAMKVAIVAVIVVALIVVFAALATWASSDATGKANGIVPLDAHYGECFTSDGVSVDCSISHRFEVFDLWEFDHDAVRPGTFDELYGTGACLENFTAYTGQGYYTSDWEIAEVWPSEQEWAAGDRRLVCALFDITRPATTGSAYDRRI